MGCKKMDEGGRTVPLGIFFFPVSEAANNFDKRTLAAVPSLGRGRKKNNIHTTAAAHRSSGVDPPASIIKYIFFLLFPSTGAAAIYI